MNAKIRTLTFAAVAAVALANVAQAQPVTTTIPALYDRWMYPFNSTPGTEGSAPTFGAILQPGFDDRDAQFLLAFDTAPLAPTGRAPSLYAIDSLRVSVYVSVNNQAFYDPTIDSVRSLYPTTDPEYIADSDIGSPAELFPVGFRNSWTAASFAENSPFGGFPVVPPAEGARNAFPSSLDECGLPSLDVSRQVRQRFDAEPIALGQTSAVAPGELLPQGAELTFAVDLSNPATLEYVQRSFSEGRLLLIVSSLSPASGGPGGGTGDPAYPAFFTRDNGLAQTLGWTPKLRATLETFARADINHDGFVDAIDYDQFIGAFVAADPAADYNGDCFPDAIDYDLFVNDFLNP